MFAVRGTRLFDGRELVEPPVVLVDGRTILGVGVAVPQGIEVVELDGPDGSGHHTVLPGLVDCHQHLCFDGSGPLEQQVAGVGTAELADRARTAARTALEGGVTTLRDLGDRGWVTLDLRGDDDLPTIVAAGPPITRPDGHCWYLGGGCTDEASLRAAVAERVGRGCDVVKVMVTGGALSPGSSYPMWESQFSAGELRLIVDDAHGAGLPVAAHCHGSPGIAASIDAGVDSIEHCTFFTPSGGVELDDALIDRLAASGVVVSATLGRLPDAVLSPLIAANEPLVREGQRRMIACGATVVVGTDAGVSPFKPHDVLPLALADLVESGMTPLDGLRSMTTGAAAVCGVAQERGRLAAGYEADLLAVAGDPLTDPAALAHVAAVWRAGRRVR